MAGSSSAPRRSLTRRIFEDLEGVRIFRGSADLYEEREVALVMNHVGYACFKLHKFEATWFCAVRRPPVIDADDALAQATLHVIV